MIATFLSQIKQYKRAALLTPALTVLEVAAEISIPMLIANIIDKGVSQGDIAALFRYGGLMLVAAIASLAIGLLAGSVAAEASSGFAANLRSSIFENIQRFSFANIDKYSSAGLITRLTTDVTHLQQAFQMSLRLLVRAPCMLLFALFMAFSINARISLVFVVAIAFLALCLGLIIAKATGIFNEVFQKYDDLNASVQENVSGIRVVKAFVRERFEIEKFGGAVERLYTLFVRAEKTVNYSFSAMMTAMYGCILAIGWMGANMILAGDLTTGQLTSLFSYVMNILISLMMLSMVFVMMTMSMASMRRISEVLWEQPEIVSPDEPVTTVADGAVSFRDVSFRYNPQRPVSVLQNISVDIRPGETVGVMGTTGSGKSSLVSLISRLYDASEGSVSVGGVDVREYDLAVLRGSVSIVLQKNLLFSGSVLENLRWGNPDATEEECRAACRIACADEFIERMPEGYQTKLEQGGANLSGGQRQRLCIARSLVKQPKILILDDATSAVDTATDAKIRRALRKSLPGTTKIIIAQRISSIEDADRILVLEEGRVNGLGTHTELLQENAIYREVALAQQQAAGDFDERGGEDA